MSIKWNKGNFSVDIKGDTEEVNGYIDKAGVFGIYRSPQAKGSPGTVWFLIHLKTGLSVASVGHLADAKTIAEKTHSLDWEFDRFDNEAIDKIAAAFQPIVMQVWKDRWSKKKS